MPPHILVVDDEANIREMLQQLLSITDYRVTPVATVDEALRVVAADRPQLVITDLQLEDSDGFELAERVKAIAPEVPILLLTGVLFDRESLETGSGKAIAAYVEKTAPLAHILSEVQRLLGR